MLLTVPILYYKPIQEQALKIKEGRTDRIKEKRRLERGGGYCQRPVSSKAIPFHSCLKALFCFCKGH